MLHSVPCHTGPLSLVLLLPLSTAILADNWCLSGPGNVFGIISPNANTTSITNQPLNIFWINSYCDPNSSDYDPQWCIPTGSGTVALFLYEYIAIPPSTCRTNFSAIILNITTSSPNNGSLAWTPPSSLPEADNYIISGNIVWTEKTLWASLQSDLFTVVHKAGDKPPPDAAESAAASMSSVLSTSSASYSHWLATLTQSETTPSATESTAGASGSTSHSTTSLPEMWVVGLLSSFLTLLGGPGYLLV